MASGRRLAANLFTGVLNNIFRICIQVVMLPLMARWLGPTEIGLYAMATPMFSFVALLADAGVGDSLAQDKSKTTLVWSSAFWGVTAISAVLACAVYAASFVVAYFSGQPRLPEIMLPLSMCLFLTSFTIIPYTLLLKEGNMTPGTIADFLATLSGAIVGLVLAYKFRNVWAFVSQFLVTSIVRAVIVNFVRPFIPRWEFSLKSLLAHTRIGGAILGGRLIDLGGRNMETAQVRRAMGDIAIGYFGYANQIGRFFSDAISNPMWANLYYVAINRGQEDVLKHYVRSHRLFGLVIFPGVVMLSLALPTLVPILLGPKWSGSTYPIMALVLSSPFPALASYCGAVLFARKKVRIMWISTFIYTAARVVSAFIAWRYGVLGLTIGVSIINLAYYAYVVFYVSPIIGNKAFDLIKAIAGPVAAAAVTGVCFYYLQALLPSGLVGLPGPAWMPAMAWLAVSGALSFLVYPALLFLLDNRRMRADLSMVMGLLQNKREPV